MVNNQDFLCISVCYRIRATQIVLHVVVLITRMIKDQIEPTSLSSITIYLPISDLAKKLLKETNKLSKH